MQKQQPADYDLLAVFNDETTAESAAAKLRKEGYSEEEVFQLASGTAGAGQFREHGPSTKRNEIFLQTKRTGPNPLLIILLAIVFGIIFGGGVFVAILIFVAIHLSFLVLPEPTAALTGGGIGVLVGAITGLLRRGRVRGYIGQDLSKMNTVPKTPAKGARTLVALRFPDSENISRRSRARAILIQNGGKIDRSVGRTK